MQLVADIGATNARFQLASGDDLLGAPVVLPTAEFSQADQLLQAGLAELNTTHEAALDSALLALAGPIRPPNNGHTEIEVTNTGLLLNAEQCSAALGCPTHLVNDFLAMAHGVPHFRHLTQLGGSAPSDQNKALLGPGTGLGMATLVREPGRTELNSETRWRVLASEGGHADLAPGNHLEAELWSVLSTQHDHVCWETVLCGSGLQNLYRAMCQVWGDQAKPLTPADISEQGVSMSDPICHQTLETFCALLGSAAGNLAITMVTRGGVYIGGGIVPRMLDFVQSSPMRRRFEERGDMSHLVADVPIMIISDPDPGLMGALHCLRAL